MSFFQPSLAAIPATRRTGVAEPAGIGAERAPRVAIYHDQALSRAALTALLQENGIVVSGSAPIDVESLLAGSDGEPPDVALVSVSGQGIALAHRLGSERRSRVLLKLDAPPDRNHLLSVAATGASGAICRQCPPERVLRAIRALAAGGVFFECTHQPAASTAPPPLLTERERHVALELARGAGTEEIAATLCISPHTARTHVRNIKRKLGARTTAQAVALTISSGLVLPPDA